MIRKQKELENRCKLPRLVEKNFETRGTEDTVRGLRESKHGEERRMKRIPRGDEDGLYLRHEGLQTG